MDGYVVVKRHRLRIGRNMFRVDRVNNIKSTNPRFNREDIIHQREDAAEPFFG